MNDAPPAVRRLIYGLFPCALLVGCGVNPGSTPTAQEIREAQTNAIASVGARGKIEEKQYPPGKGHVVDLSGVTITDEDLAALKGVGTIAELSLSSSTITDEQFAKIASGEYKLNNLFKLDISDTQITDVGLSEAQNLPLLAVVNVKGSKVTDAGIKAFEQAKAKKKLPFGLKVKVEK